MRIAFWGIFGAALVLQVICVGIATTSNDPVYTEVAITFLAFLLLLVIAIANTRFRMRDRVCRDLSLWIGNQANKTSILTPDPLRVQPAMTIQPSIQTSERALGQA